MEDSGNEMEAPEAERDHLDQAETWVVVSWDRKVAGREVEAETWDPDQGQDEDPEEDLICADRKKARLLLLLILFRESWPAVGLRRTEELAGVDLHSGLEKTKNQGVNTE